jgi:hypothetical protein
MGSAGESGENLLIASLAVITVGETFRSAGFDCLELGVGENLQALPTTKFGFADDQKIDA